MNQKGVREIPWPREDEEERSQPVALKEIKKEREGERREKERSGEEQDKEAIEAGMASQGLELTGLLGNS